MKIIVTGSTGNLGSHIIKNSDHHYLGINRTNWNQLSDVHENNYDAIIHCAYDLKNSITMHPVKNLDSNILSTAKILEVARDKKVKTFVFVSSCAVYGDSSNSAEDKPCIPVTMNGHIKLFNEELVKSFCKSNNINYLILRVFNTYGGNDEFSVVQRMIKCSQNKTSFTLINDGISERDFIFVEDVASIIRMLLEQNISNEIINIGSGESVKIKDIFNAVQKKYGTIDLINKENPNEAVFSRANTQKMKKFISFKTKNILEWIENS